MEDIGAHLVDIGMTILSTALFALIGFVWRISHKVNALEKQVKHQREIRARDNTELRREIDMIISNVDKNREWSTNRMMSIVKDIPR